MTEWENVLKRLINRRLDEAEATLAKGRDLLNEGDFFEASDRIDTAGEQAIAAARHLDLNSDQGGR
jgi:hypothetical protein